MRPHFTGGGSGKPRNTPAPPPKAKAPPRRPSAGPPPRNPTAPRYEYREGIPIGTVLLCIIALGLGAFAVMLFLPKNLSHIQGYAPALTEPQQRNLYMESLPALLERQGQKTFTEEEVNHYLKTRVQGAQRGSFDSLAKFKGVYVDLEPGEAEIYIERTIFGLRNTMSLRMVKNRYNDQLIWESAGGTVGKFSMGTKQFDAVVNAFKRLSVTLDEESRILTGMRDVTLEKDRITLIP